MYLRYTLEEALIVSNDAYVSQGDHLSGKPGNVRKFDSCQGYVRDFTRSQANFREKILSGEKLTKTVYCKLHICVQSMQVF